MEALNIKEVRKGYLHFSLLMLVVIALPVFICSSLYGTAKHEAQKIEMRSGNFDSTFAMQVELVDKVDSLQYYMSLLNSSAKINDLVVQSVISSRKMALVEDVSSMSNEDVRLYKDLLNSMNTFLMVKDSIRILGNEEQTLRMELRRCVSADQQASRRLTLTAPKQ